MTLALLLLLLVLATFHRFFPSLLVWSGATKLFSRSSLERFCCCCCQYIYNRRFVAVSVVVVTADFYYFSMLKPRRRIKLVFLLLLLLQRIVYPLWLLYPLPSSFTISIPIPLSPPPLVLPLQWTLLPFDEARAESETFC